MAEKKLKLECMVLDDFVFSDYEKVAFTLALLSPGCQHKFLEKMKEVDIKSFVKMMLLSPVFRGHVLKHLPRLAPDQVLTVLSVQRKVINNPTIRPESSMSFALSKMKSDAMMSFCNDLLENSFR